MNLFKTLLVAVVATVALARADLALGQNLVINGNFNDNTTGWLLTGNTDNCFVQADQIGTGTDAIPWFLAGPTGSDGSLSQFIDTTPGSQYVFSFTLANLDYGPPNDFTAQASDFTLATYTNSIAFDPVFLSGIFTATSSQTDILFSFRNDGSYWAFNNVSVMAVPEPLTWVMLVGGFGFLLMLRRRRWN